MINISSLKNLPYYWTPIEKELGYSINENYKLFYETIGAIGIDDYIYIVSPTNSDFIDGLVEFNKDVYTAYLQLEQYLNEDHKIKFFEGWLSVGYTTNGDYIFCDSSRVMITDEAFEEREIYDNSLLEFIELYLADELRFEVLSDGMVGKTHEMVLITKTSNQVNDDLEL